MTKSSMAPTSSGAPTIREGRAGVARIPSAGPSRVPGMDSRLRALCDLNFAESREYAGRHEYDGRLQDLSPDGVRRALAALGGDRLDDAYDEALTAAKEAEATVLFGELEQHRTNP